MRPGYDPGREDHAGEPPIGGVTLDQGHMSTLFEVSPYDGKVYEEQIRDFLPERLIDIHTHVWRAADRTRNDDGPRRTVSWPDRVAAESPIDQLLATYELMFPGKKVTPLIFGSAISRRDNLEAQNRYVAECVRTNGLPGLVWSIPEWSGRELERRIIEGKFLGAKSYLANAPEHLAESEITIFDFFPPHQLEVLDRHGWIMMLHIPRPGRLKDPVNLAQMIEIEEKYPNIRLIIAHVGRAYCPEDIGDAFITLARTRNMVFDISANTNAANFATLLRAVGPKRVLFGSDLPITRMRMRRICKEGRYVNLVPRGLYGDVSGDKNMEEVDGEDLTFFLYEEIMAFRRAAEAVGLTRTDVEDVFHGNARRIIEGAQSHV